MAEGHSSSIGRRDRRTLLGVAQLVVSVAALAGSVQLAAGVATPPTADLERLGLSSWLLPAGWLFCVVAVPFALAGFLTLRGAPAALGASLTASALLLVELASQLPFVGFNAMQLVMAGIAVATGALAWGERPRP